MKKTSNGKIKLKDIKHVENSRMRGTDDVSDLMEDIEQRGLLENIGIRKKDNALIFGNRRVKAFEKLGYIEIPCDFFEDVSDDELLITNLAENIKRRQIGSIEIGRICSMLKDRGMTRSEMAVKLGLPINRIESATRAFQVVVGTPFEQLIVFKELGRNRKGIPEKLIWIIQQNFARSRRILSKDDWNILLSAAEKGEFSLIDVRVLKTIFAFDPKISMVKALEILKFSKVVRLETHFNAKILLQEMKKAKCSSEVEFLRHIIKSYNTDLLF